MLTPVVKVGFTVIVMELLTTLFVETQPKLLVRITVTTSLLFNVVDVNVG